MVPIPDTIYFPPLEKCLSHEQLLISWSTLYVVLCDPISCERNQVKLQNLLSDEKVQRLLQRPFNPFAFAPGNQSRSAFETKTAAINVTPTNKSQYNIGEIKDDALWLSKEVEIDEISALRIITLEYQLRASAQLHGDFSDEEIASLQEPVGNFKTETSVLVSRSLLLRRSTSEDQSTPASTDARRLRTLRIYLSERRNLLKCAELILHMGLRQELTTAFASSKDKQANQSWVQAVGQNLLSAMTSDGKSHEYMNYCVKALKGLMEKLSNGSGWFKSEGGRQDVELEWFASQVAEATHAMKMVFLLLDYGKDVRNSANLLEWFRFTTAFGYFDQFDPPDPSLQSLVISIQSLTAVISLSMLQPSSSLTQLNEKQFALTSGETGKDLSYLCDVQAMIELHDMFLSAATRSSIVASPAILAWSVILLSIRNSSAARREARELRQSQRAEERFERDSSPDGQDFAESERMRPGSRRRSSASSDISLEASMYDDLLESVMDTTIEDDPIAFLGTSAIDRAQVLDVLASLAQSFGSSAGFDLDAIFSARIRILILDLIRCSIELTSYIPETVTAAIAALNGGQEYWDQLAKAPLTVDDDPVATFLDDPYLVERLLQTSRSRYPYESQPFLKIVRAIATCETVNEEGTPITLQILQTMPSFTYVLPHHFRDYETSNEDENSNTIRLTRPALLFRPQGEQLNDWAEHSNSWSADISQTISNFQIPPGTIGRIVSEDGPKVAIWYHKYSALKYMGKLLETALTAGDYVDAITGQQANRDDVTEIISLLATLLRTGSKIDRANDEASRTNEIAYHLLEEASDGLDRSRDIISVVFSLFEEELQRQSAGTASDSSLDLLVACVQFIHALTPILPSRVWPLLGRSGLLDQDGIAGKLSAILTSIELISARYDFLISCTYLYQALVEDSVTNSVIRSSTAKAVVRFGSSEGIGSGVPKQALSKVLLSFTRSLTGIFEISCNWRFTVPEQRVSLSRLISGTFDDILHYVYGVDDAVPNEKRVTVTLASSAKHIADTFLSSTSGPLRFQPILRALHDGISTPYSVLEPQSIDRWISQINSVLRLTATLIQFGTLLERPSSQLQHMLFQVSPLIARMYAVRACYRLPVIALLEALVLSASNSSDEPPSLLGHLGQQTSRNFLRLLSDLGKPLDDDDQVARQWEFMSAIIGKRQQWFAIYILTGKRPRDSMKNDANGNSTISPTTSMLKVALEALSDIKTLSPVRALAMLGFVSLAQNFWPWAMSDDVQVSIFIKAISDYMATMEPAPRTSTDKMLEEIQKTRIAACIGEILAMYLYHSRQMGNFEPTKDVLNKLAYFTSCAVSVPRYNSSLHGNLRRNFDSRFPGFGLENFKRTQLATRRPERDYYYDIKFADKVLSFDSAWKGRKNDGLAEEFVKANVNLSLVDAQVALFHGWKMLAAELSFNLPGVQDLQDIVTKTVSDCLAANMKNQPPENLFTRLTQTRADLAIILLQRLVEGNSTRPEVGRLLDTVWMTIRKLDTTFELALLSSEADYFRSLLKLLFLALRARIKMNESNESADDEKEMTRKGVSRLPTTSSRVPVVLEVIDYVVARGFRDLVAGIHDQQQSSSPDDIGLVTAILQASLRVPGIELYHSQIISSIVACDTARIATTLFSWSDKLAIDGDPVYGELSVLFLLELSSMPSMAEQLAVEGVLGHLSTASITTYLRRNNVSAFADGAGFQRCYSLWARGILPLLLNLLDSVGPSIAGEVAIFLNQFPNLLKQGADAFDPPVATRQTSLSTPRYLAFSTVSEVHSLALITRILTTFRTSVTNVNEIPDVLWDGPGVLEDVEFWLGSRLLLRERIMPIGPREVEMAKRKPLSDMFGCQNRLEEKVVEELMGIKEVLTVQEA